MLQRELSENITNLDIVCAHDNHWLFALIIWKHVEENNVRVKPHQMTFESSNVKLAFLVFNQN